MDVNRQKKKKKTFLDGWEVVLRVRVSKTKGRVAITLPIDV